ncbi:sigma-70 family RNA polymerase sigma factor [Dyella sp.]|uniref:sigma-70 family RNA polymerase sigma factor n=1 Tax=Dyella sp. TaxID=1869338 RepID=UPI002ED2C9D3
MSVSSDATPDLLNRLLQQTAAGDEKAFAQLYERSSSRLFGLCVRMLVDRREAEEVLQEAYVTAWQRASSFDPQRSSAMTWLVTLTRNKAIDRLRQHGTAHFDGDAALDGIIDDTPGPSSQAEQSEQYARLQRCLEELEPQQRRSVREAFFTGCTYHELAERTKVPLGTLKSWIRRGLLQLRACLGS